MHQLWLNNSRFESKVDLSYLRAPLLVLNSAALIKGLNANNIEIGSHLLMHETFFANAVVLLGAKIGGQLSLIGAEVTGKLDMGSMQVSSSLFMREGATFAEVVL
jgi:hypothetical protein